jgi:hypothetical protein
MSHRRPDPERGIVVNSATDPQRPGSPSTRPTGDPFPAGTSAQDTGLPAEMPAPTTRPGDSDVESPGPGNDDPL